MACGVWDLRRDTLLTSRVTFVTHAGEGVLMATERLTVLVGAAALGEFTAPELAAYTGVNPNTVRQVLQREQRRNGYFERVDTGHRSSTGRRGVLWRLGSGKRAEILDEIAREEANISELKGSISGASWRSSPTDRTAMLVATAEETVARSYDTDDVQERRELAVTALNLLRAANPAGLNELGFHDEASQLDWWNGERGSSRDEFTASLQTISPISIEAQLRTVQRSHHSADQQEEMLRLRAHRVAAFAALSERLAEGQPIGPKDLEDAAEAISAGSAILPVAQTLGWIKVFVDTSIAGGNPAPVAIVAKSKSTFHELFPVSRGGWREVRPPAELSESGYSLWVESWAEALLAYSLIPGVVVAYDGSPESNDALTTVMREAESSRLGRAFVVASTADDVEEVAAQVSLGGGFIYPLPRTVRGRAVEKLLDMVNGAVTRAVSATPDLTASYWLFSAERDLDVVTSTLDVLRTISGVVVQPADLEIAQRALAVVDDVVRQLGAVHLHSGVDSREGLQIYADLVHHLTDQLSDFGDSSHALSIAEEVLSSYRRIIQFQQLPYASRRELEWALGWAGEIAQRRESITNMVWPYQSARQDDETVE
jgi:hypothetical protein